MIFNTDPLKESLEVIFSRKGNIPYHPDIIFKNNQVKKSSFQKHFEIFLDSKLDFDESYSQALFRMNTRVSLK